MANNGEITVTYNTYTNNTQDTVTLNPSPNNIRWLTDLTIEDDKKIYVKWNDTTYPSGSAGEAIGDAINYIEEMILNPDNHHLLVRYSDPEKAGFVTYNNKNDWNDLGSVMGQFEY